MSPARLSVESAAVPQSHGAVVFVCDESVSVVLDFKQPVVIRERIEQYGYDFYDIPF